MLAVCLISRHLPKVMILQQQLIVIQKTFYHWETSKGSW